MLVLFIPLIGVLLYRIARDGKMHERAARQARAYIHQAAAGSPGQHDRPADQAGRSPRPWVISAEELEREKAEAKVLAASLGSHPRRRQRCKKADR